MAKGKRMEAFWASVANLKRPQMKEASTQTVEQEPDLELEEIILKLEAGHWRSPVTQIKKSFCDISNSMANGPPSVVAEVSSGSESELASTASYPGP